MAKTRKKKRTLTKAQRDALAKGRKRLAAKRRRSSVVKKKTSTTKRKSGGSPMARKKRKSTRTTSRRRSYVRTARNFARKSRAVEMLTDAGLAVVGGVTSGWLTSKVPIADSRIRSALPIISGIVVAGTLGTRNKIAMKVAQGMVVLGTVSLFKQLAPGVPMLAGDKVIMLPYVPDNSMGMKVRLGADRKNERMGIPVKLGGRYKTAAF